MGTRAQIIIKDGKQRLVVLYRQMDGYPSALGQDIHKILNKGDCKIINGYSSDTDCPAYFNGMSCLAAYLIGKLKEAEGYVEKQIGNIYIKPNQKSWGEDYTYTLNVNDENKVHLKITGRGYKYDGLLKDFTSEFYE